MAIPDRTVANIADITHLYGKTRALDHVTVKIPSGCVAGVIGPDGVGKSTLLGLIAGARKIQSGKLHVLGGDMADAGHRNASCPRIAYMPQGLGKNLYAELSVFENLDFFGRLYGQRGGERRARMDRLLKATRLDPFLHRPAGKLSGGMKQKLGLCCALIHDPDLLILDEPTTGVDPLSRRQFWDLIDVIRASRPGMSVLVSTAYMDEAERFDWLMAMDGGKVLATGSPAEIKAQTGAAGLEEAFVALLPEAKRGGRHGFKIPSRVRTDEEPVIVAKNLTRRFGDFTAVDNVSFAIERGEIFGFLGSNGCGKTTTMKMLTGLLPASEGAAYLFGKRAEAHDLQTRQRVGYMSQSFSLYGELSVRQNLSLHAHLFHLAPERFEKRIDELVQRFGLDPYLDDLADKLPLGVRQRLSLAVAILHEPEMLILDEPTSGVDPVARDEFWELLIAISRSDNATIFISTHFMNEAMRCDRISLMHAGKVLACDAPAALQAARGAKSLEAAFIGYIEDAIGDHKPDGDGIVASDAVEHAVPDGKTVGSDGRKYFINPRRLLAYSYRETLEVLRDPVRLAFAFLGSALLMFFFGFGINMDVNAIRYAALDFDQTPESRDYLQNFAGSRYFIEQPPLADQDQVIERLKANEISLAIEIPPNFGRHVSESRAAEVSVRIDGSNPFRAETIQGYVEGAHSRYLMDLARRQSSVTPVGLAANIQPRYRYNPTFESINAIGPSMPALLLVLIPSILMAVSVVREKELGSITNFYVTPTTRLEFLLGKQLPYVVIAMLNFALLTFIVIILFQVPLKGSFIALTAGALLYVTSTTGIGLLISSFTSSQVAAVFATAIVTMMPSVQFSGMLQPVSTLEGGARVMGSLWPTTYFMHMSVGAFTKGLGAVDLAGDLIALAMFIPVFTILSEMALRKQER